jgi:hypothetical protein
MSKVTKILSHLSPISLEYNPTPTQQITQAAKGTALLSILAILARAGMEKLPSKTDPKEIADKLLISKLNSETALLSPDPDLDDLDEELRKTHKGLEKKGFILPAIDESNKVVSPKYTDKALYNRALEQGLIDKGVTYEEFRPIAKKTRLDHVKVTQDRTGKQSMPYTVTHDDITEQRGKDVTGVAPVTENKKDLYAIMFGNRDALLTFAAVMAPLLAVPYAWNKMDTYLKDRKNKKIEEDNKKKKNLLDKLYYDELNRVKGMSKSASGDELGWWAYFNPFSKAPRTIRKDFIDAGRRVSGEDNPSGSTVEALKGLVKGMARGAKSSYAVYSAVFLLGSYYAAKRYLDKTSPNEKRLKEIQTAINERGKYKDAPKLHFDSSAFTPSGDIVSEPEERKSLAPVKMSDKEISI